jgi:hypothetical protein
VQGKFGRSVYLGSHLIYVHGISLVRPHPCFMGHGQRLSVSTMYDAHKHNKGFYYIGRQSHLSSIQYNNYSYQLCQPEYIEGLFEHVEVDGPLLQEGASRKVTAVADDEVSHCPNCGWLLVMELSASVYKKFSSQVHSLRRGRLTILHRSLPVKSHTGHSCCNSPHIPLCRCTFLGLRNYHRV